MNKRIQELHNQARDFYLQDEHLDCSTKDLHRMVQEKFAELIVRECIIVHKDNYGIDIIGNVLKEHFGIQE